MYSQEVWKSGVQDSLECSAPRILAQSSFALFDRVCKNNKTEREKTALIQYFNAESMCLAVLCRPLYVMHVQTRT